MQRQWRLSVPALMLVLFAAFAVTPTSTVQADDDATGSFVGSWIGTINPGTPFAFTDLVSINRGGTLTGTNGNAHDSQNPSAPPFHQVDGSDFFGSWEPIGHHQFAVTVKWLLFLGPNPTIDEAVLAIYCPDTTCGPDPFPGQNIGLVTLQTVTILQTKDSFTGPYTIQFTDLNGNVVFAGSGTLSFSRIAIEPLAQP